MSTIRTIAYQPGGGVKIVTEPLGEPAAGQVQIKTSACGVCQWDVYTYCHGSDCTTPAPPGHEGVGRIVALGEGVTRWRVGDRVISCGIGFAEACNLCADDLVALPASTEVADQHWLVEPASCVVTGLDHCQVKAGDRVAVVGCGFMGLMFIQALAHYPLDRLIAVDVQDSRLCLADQFGATDVLNPTKPEYAEKITSIGALDIDTVVDATGAQAGLDLATRLSRPGGRILLFGWNHGPTTFDGNRWQTHGYTIINASPASAMRDVFPIAVRLIQRRVIDLQPLVSDVVSLDGFAQLLARAGKRDAGYLKGVVTYE